MGRPLLHPAGFLLAATPSHKPMVQSSSTNIGKAPLGGASRPNILVVIWIMGRGNAVHPGMVLCTVHTPLETHSGKPPKAPASAPEELLIWHLIKHQGFGLSVGGLHGNIISAGLGVRAV